MKFTKEELEKIKKEKMEEIDRWLDNEYGCSYTRLEELHDFLIDRNMKFQDELDKYKNIVNDIEKYIRYYKVEDIEEKTMLILNDILLIKNGMSDSIDRLKGE